MLRYVSRLVRHLNLQPLLPLRFALCKFVTVRVIPDDETVGAKMQCIRKVRFIWTDHLYPQVDHVFQLLLLVTEEQLITRQTVFLI